jgi:hypothetical protein
MSKQKRCCAQVNTQLMQAKGDLSRLARKAAVAAARNYSIARYVKAIEAAKAIVREAEARVVNHEAEHAEQNARQNEAHFTALANEPMAFA